MGLYKKDTSKRRGKLSGKDRKVFINKLRLFFAR